ncbi:unnamed protein product [Caenorhabditis brenneri]
MNRLLFFFGLLGLTLANFSIHGFVGESESNAKSVLEQHLKVFQEMIQKGDKDVLKTMIPNENQTDSLLDALIKSHRSIKMEVKEAEYSKNGSKENINGNVYYSKNEGQKVNVFVTIKKESQSPSGYRFVAVTNQPSNKRKFPTCAVGFIWCYLYLIDILPGSF